MTADTEVVCNDVVRKVEIEEKCVAGLDMSDLDEVGAAATVDGNVGGNGNVGGDNKEDTDDSSYVFVGGGIEVTGGDPGDTGGVNVSTIAPKSESADEVDQFKKEELGIENKGIPVDSLVLETNGITHASATASDAEVKAVYEVTLDNGSTFDLPVVPETNDIAQDANGHLGMITGEEGVVVKNTDEVESANGIMNVEAKTDIVAGVTFDPEPTLNPIERSQVTVFESEPTIKTFEGSESHATINQSVSTPDLINTTGESLPTLNSVRHTDCEVMVNDGLESVSTLIEKAECQATVDGSGKPPEDLECQVTADGSESSGGPIKERECQVKVDASAMPSDELKCQVTADMSESSGIPIKELECQVTVDGSGKPSEDLACQLKADGSQSSGSPMKEREVSAVGSESIGSSVDNQECPVSVDGSESSGNRTEEVDSSTIVIVSDRKSEDSLIVTPKVDVEAEPNQVCGGMKVEHQSESLSATDHFENKETPKTLTGLGTESEENSESGLVLSENPDALANGQVEKSDGILEMGETHLSQTEADGVPLVSNAEEKSEEKLEKQGEGSSETLIKITEPVELDANFEETKEQLKTEDEIQESQIVVTDNVQNDLDLEDNTAESTTKAEAPLETETNIESITHEIIASEYEVSSRIDDTQEVIRLEISAENVEKQGEGSSETMIAITGSVESDAKCEETKEQVKIEDEIPESHIVVTDNVRNDLDLEDNTAESTTEAEAPLETETNIKPIPHEITASQYEVSSCIDETQEHIQSEGSAENVETLPSTDSMKSECENSELLVEKENDSLSNPDDSMVVERKVEVEAHLVTENRSAESKNCGTGIENADDDEEKETEVKDEPVGDNSTLSLPDTNVNPVAVIEFGSIGRHETVHDMHDEDVIDGPDVVNGEMKPACVANSDNPERNVDGSQGDRNSDKMLCPEVEDMDGVQSDEVPTSSAEGSISDALDVQNEEAEVLAYNFLIRIPRFEDETFRDQIRSAQVQVDEKTRLRDAIRVEIQGKRARLKDHNEEFNTVKLEETAARRLVRLKRQEIDSVQSVINRVKNAMSVKDIDGRIYNMEHMIQHETLCLKDEKQFIREIKQLKTLRDQLASNMGSQDEVQQALDQKDQNEERMKTLRKELDSLKDKVSKAEAVVIAVGKKYDEESRKERELQAQFRAADDVRQKAYAHLNSLKKQTYDKNKNFRLYKEDVMAARDFASRGDKDALHRLCANQVEAFMEQWNNNAEFRNEYISRCNMNASRRQRTLDGGSLGPDDISPVLPSNVNEKVDRSLVSVPDHKSTENLSGQKNQTLKTKGVVKLALGSDTVTVTGRDESIDNGKEEENTLTKEEMEMARKAEELRKAEIAAKLKEQRRLEEKAKATEALERKKRNAEKAQIRAELRAKKEAEQKEKEREKRLRKKEKKKAGGDGSINGEEVASSESSNEAPAKGTEAVKEMTKKKSSKPPPHFFSKQLKPKPVPPPLANRNRKRWQQWGKLVLAAVAILALFLLGNTGFFLNLRVLNKANGGI
ncbi:uncharacterized protein LOC112524635 isoform X2 [Cynara cardunculus var. scolymus]|uniref:uncharacterized protein LOC112524635 isoform X2 n=1 Tax=Cynara cardunculus var. scolymus TaxID=59895 RepID=UPI000D62C790|nr:uncharacterized protein LOC112524635 isoform X2 [Cynara cardunculus var. scolymus]